MAGSTVKIDGLAEVMANLQQLPADLELKVLTKAGRDAAEVFAQDARSRAPFEDEKFAEAHGGKEHTPGALRNSIRVVTKKFLPPGMTLGFSVIAGSPQVYWASWLEWGFHHIGSGAFIQIPYMRPAFDSEKEVVLAQLTAAISAALARMQNGRISG